MNSDPDRAVSNHFEMFNVYNNKSPYNDGSALSPPTTTAPKERCSVDRFLSTISVILVTVGVTVLLIIYNPFANTSPSTTPTTPVSQESILDILNQYPEIVDLEEMDFLGPFPSWINAVQSGCKGDGIFDNTPVLMRLLHSLGTTGNSSVLYFPAGRYKITSTLTTPGTSGLSFFGEDPESTVIVWDGPVCPIVNRSNNMAVPHCAMFHFPAGFFHQFRRLTFDGQHKASTGIAEFFNTTIKGVKHSGSYEFTDLIFQNLSVGIFGGRLGSEFGQLDSEGHVTRCLFRGITSAGVNVGCWNALNWWVFDSHFINCAIGVTNIFSVGDVNGAGNFLVYRSLFQNSSVADSVIGNTGWFAIYDSVSQYSNRFFYAYDAGTNGATLLLTGNRVLYTKQPAAIYYGNLGPLMLFDNEIKSHGNSSAPAAVNMWSGSVGPKLLFAIGNNFTMNNPMITSNNNKQFTMVQFDNNLVAHDEISSSLFAIPPVAHHNTESEVFSLPMSKTITFTDKDIQKLIDAAVANSTKPNPIIHLPAQNYYIYHAIVIPPRFPITIVGDGYNTVLIWQNTTNKYPRFGEIMNASGEVTMKTPASLTATFFLLQSPSQATLRELYFLANWNSALIYTLFDADKVNGRLFHTGCNFPIVQMSHLHQTRVSLQGNTGCGSLLMNDAKSVVNIGCNIGQVQVRNHSNAYVQDTWSETTYSNLIDGDSGLFTYAGGKMAPLSHEPYLPQSLNMSAIHVNNFDGHMNVIGVGLNLQHPKNRILVDNSTSRTNALFLASDCGTLQDYYHRSAAAVDPNTPVPSPFHNDNNGLGNVGFMFGISRQLNNSLPNYKSLLLKPSEGNVTESFIRQSLQQYRNIRWVRSDRTQYKFNKTSRDATNVVIFRVGGPDTAGGIITGLRQPKNSPNKAFTYLD